MGEEESDTIKPFIYAGKWQKMIVMMNVLLLNTRENAEDDKGKDLKAIDSFYALLLINIHPN